MERSNTSYPRTLQLLCCAMAAFSLLALSACEATDEESQALDDAFMIGEPTDAPPLPEVGEGCHVERFQQAASEINRKVDILFVVDSSTSLNAERGDIADGVDGFLDALPAEADYQIGVMLAHGPHGSQHGKLWKYGSGDSNAVLTQDMAMADLKAELRLKMTDVASDNASDGGEMGLHGLNASLSGEKLEAMQSAGFYRDDAALAVIFVADENDICSDFPEGVTPVPDPQGKEDSSKANDCDGISPESVLANLEAHQGDRPLFVSGVLYTDTQTYEHTGENEIGYGYRETVRLANGLIIDLANPHYHEGLGQLGALATEKLNLQYEFDIAKSGIEPASLQAWVDGEPVPVSYIEDLNQAHLTDEAGGSQSYVDITYCMKQEPSLISATCSAGEFVPKSSVNLGISTDPDAGMQATFDAGFGALGITPTYYSDAEVAAGKPVDDGVTVLVISQKVVLEKATDVYVQGVINYIESGGSILAEYDGAALMFDSFEGSHQMISQFDPYFGLLTGNVSGGGVLLPIEQSRAYVTDAYHPIMEGMPSDFLNGLRTAFSVTGYDGEWLHTSAVFKSTGYLDQVPEGTHPAVLSGRCGQGRMALFMMNHLAVMNQSPVDRMVENTLNWVTGL